MLITHFRLRHLVVERPHDRSHFFGNRSRDKHQIGLSRRRSLQIAEALAHVPTRHHRRDHLHTAAGKAKLQPP